MRLSGGHAADVADVTAHAHASCSASSSATIIFR
jgi:hypothetical protein